MTHSARYITQYASAIVFYLFVFFCTIFLFLHRMFPISHFSLYVVISIGCERICRGRRDEIFTLVATAYHQTKRPLWEKRE